MDGFLDAKTPVAADYEGGKPFYAPSTLLRLQKSIALLTLLVCYWRRRR